MKAQHATAVVIRKKPVSTPTPGPVYGPDGIPARLRMLRDLAGISFREQDRLAGLTPGHSHAIDQGRVTARINAGTLAQFCRIYGCTLDWLYFGKGDAPTTNALDLSLDRAYADLDDATEEISKVKKKLRSLI